MGSAQPGSEERGGAAKALPFFAVGFEPLQLCPEDFKAWPSTQFLSEGIPEKLGVPPPGVEIVQFAGENPRKEVDQGGALD